MFGGPLFFITQYMYSPLVTKHSHQLLMDTIPWVTGAARPMGNVYIQNQLVLSMVSDYSSGTVLPNITSPRGSELFSRRFLMSTAKRLLLYYRSPEM